MIHSMTGFGTGRTSASGGASGTAGGYGFDVEVKSVNHKFCDVRARMPSFLAVIESKIAGYVRDRLDRGSVDVVVRVRETLGPVAKPQVNEALALAYIEAFRRLDGLTHAGEKPSTAWVASQPDVIAIEGLSTDPDQLWALLEPALNDALVHVIAMRRAEGRHLVADFETRLKTLAAMKAEIVRLAPEVVPAMRERLHKKIDDLKRTASLPDVDPQRIAQEVALLAERADIEEELTRFDAHLAQFAQLLKADEPAGRKLDFLVQELNREANTMGSKTPSSAITHLVVELKSEIERIREQVQNVR